ncbi:acyl-CoA dehydrogenase family protein [Pseudonocardia spinosispora]|uniref:acyl-CoA dehydrogenase family protein n=1 Tax=Pseudonocardia spinosispora TaxID=103441 RepID=UPI00040B8DED|nr:acyl-CoA dehydrogenase family protein [Pseudonocardia spinosispora]
MNLEIDRDQLDLVRTTAEVCAEQTELWRASSTPDLTKLGQVGVLGVRHPEPEGSGLGPVEAVLVARECGAALAPTPLLVWADLAGPAVPGGLSGQLTVTGTLSAERVVSFGGATDLVLVTDADGALAVRSDTLTWQPLDSVDPAVPRARIVDAEPEGERVADADAVRDWRWQARLLAAAHLSGLGRAAVSTAVAHALDRHQFGRPIGGFQAVKHLLADAHTDVELAFSQTLLASVCWAEGDERAADQADAAALVALRAALTASETAIQVHGGMGFTWESTPHRYYKRALLIAEEFGVESTLGVRLAGRGLSLNGSRSAS